MNIFKKIIVAFLLSIAMSANSSTLSVVDIYLISAKPMTPDPCNPFDPKPGCPW